MENINLQNLAQEIIDKINDRSFFVEPFMEEKNIDQKVIQDAYQIIKAKDPSFIAECNELDGSIRRIFKKNI